MEEYWKSLDVGSEVFWDDPDDALSSGHFFIHEIVTETGLIEDWDSTIIIKSSEGDISEVYAQELRDIASSAFV